MSSRSWDSGREARVVRRCVFINFVGFVIVVHAAVGVDCDSESEPSSSEEEQEEREGVLGG